MGYGRSNAAWLAAAGGANARRLEKVRKGLIGYLGEDFPRGHTLEEWGFEGPLTPEAGPLLSGAFSQAQNFAGSPMATERAGALSRLLGGEQSFTADPALRERYFKEAVTDPAMRYFDETVAPSIAARYGRGGNLGAAAYSTARAGGDLAGELSGVRASLLREDERLAASSRDSALARMAGALPLSMQEQIQPIQLGLQVGDIERSIRGQGIQERLQRALLAQPFSDPRLGLLGLAGLGQIQIPTASGGGGPGGIGGALMSIGSAFAPKLGIPGMGG